MGLQTIYESFLKKPTYQSLAESATLQYVTTLKNINKDIPNHLEDQNKNIVKKKSEKIISAIEGPTAIAVIVDTTLEFISHGGAYLPGLDSFIIDKVATLPITHFVHFDKNDKITQIRLSWDQGDLLKQAEVIGRSGKNWPVFSGKDQLNMISASSTSANELNPAPPMSPRGGSRQHADRPSSPTKKYIRDPHASLDLTKEHQDEQRTSVPNPVAPRQPVKPQEREMSDLFAAGHEDYQPNGPGGSPKKTSKDAVVAPKGAGHKKFQPSRLFDEDSPPAKERQIYKTNPARYNHFNIGDEVDNDPFQHRSENARPTEAPIRPKGGAQRGNFQSQWDFESFSTPDKPQGKIRDQDVVHFSYADEGADPKVRQAKQMNGRIEAESHFEFRDSGTPNYRPAVPKARKDQSHFDFNDEPTPAGRRIIARTAAASKLYADPVFGDGEEEKPLKNITNTARKDLASHWGTDDEPINPKTAKQGLGRKELESHWDVADDKVAAKPTARAGGRKDAEKSFWDF